MRASARRGAPPPSIRGILRSRDRNSHEAESIFSFWTREGAGRARRAWRGERYGRGVVCGMVMVTILFSPHHHLSSLSLRCFRWRSRAPVRWRGSGARCGCAWGCGVVSRERESASGGAGRRCGGAGVGRGAGALGVVAWSGREGVFFFCSLGSALSHSLLLSLSRPAHPRTPVTPLPVPVAAWDWWSARPAPCPASAWRAWPHRAGQRAARSLACSGRHRRRRRPLPRLAADLPTPCGARSCRRPPPSRPRPLR